MINNDRLRDTFLELVKIDSVSRYEDKVAQRLKEILEEIGADVVFDNAGELCGSNSGNLIARFKGTVEKEPIFLCGHMDTVEPGKNIKPVFRNGIFKSDGTTILGSDDKSALAIIIETMKIILENKLSYPPVEVIFTVCEEIGLLGAKNIDLSLMKSKFGYILDAWDTDGIITKAPSANKFTVKVFGKAAHAGNSPEKGINAMSIASKAISGLNIGRVDDETTCNLGVIRGGVATNIVPELIEIDGEVRSHDEKKLADVTNTICNAFISARNEFNKNGDLPEVEIKIENDFPKTDIQEDSEVLLLAQKAAQNLGRELKLTSTGGGADANIFCGKDIMTGVLGTGMKNVHTVNESISLADMVKSTELLLEILKIYSSEH